MSLATKLQREVQANPVKAGALGLLLLVAGYFWAPLLMGFFKSSETPVAAEPAATPPLNSAAPGTASVGQTDPQAGPDTTTYDWRKHAQLADEDPLMRPDVELPGDRDPFDSPEITAPPVTPQPAETQPVIAEPLTPADLGLVLGTTLLGPHKKVAEIGGKSYTVGDLIDIGDEAGGASFEVLEIEPRRVVLGSEGMRYELTISRPLVDSAAQAMNRRTRQQKTADTADDPKQGKQAE